MAACEISEKYAGRQEVPQKFMKSNIRVRKPLTRTLYDVLNGTSKIGSLEYSKYYVFQVKHFFESVNNHSRFWTFTAGDQTLKWRTAGGIEVWWLCQYQSPIDSLAASYMPRTQSSGLRNGVLRVSESALDIVDTIFLSLILLTTGSTEWRTVKSPYTKETLEASLRSDATGSLPPYIPLLDSPTPRRAVRRPTTRTPRRPRTAGATPYADSINPPAYESRADMVTPY